MQIVTTKKKLLAAMTKEREAARSVALVPTMGALHEGHLTLVRRATAACDTTVVSIFVNPRQFDNPNDLKNYPRLPEKDLSMLEKTSMEYVFMPTVEDIYDDLATERVFDFGPLDKVMEGAHRPGHFEGVVQIVSRLFDLVRPDVAFFGEKDFQQLAIIKKMVDDCGYSLKIASVPIVREVSGLALSSRNQHLTPEQLDVAPKIFSTLVESKALKAVGKTVAEVTSFVEETLNKLEPIHVEYFEIVDATTLQRIERWEESPAPVGCIACFCGAVRLIDNIRFDN